MPLPRARLDPIVDEATAIAVLASVATLPVRHETILALLDRASCGVALVVVGGTADPDSVVTIVDHTLRSVSSDIAALAIATIRPGGGDDDLADAERWLEIDAIATDYGIRLLDWFVLTDGVSRPRRLVNEPSRWPAEPTHSSPTPGSADAESE